MDSRGSPGLAEDPTGYTELLAKRAGIAIPNVRETRAYTTARLEEIRAAFRAEELPDTVSVCVFGSWARDELTPSSDDDWALLTAGELDEEQLAPDVLRALEVSTAHLGGDGHEPGSTATFGVPFDMHTLAANIGPAPPPPADVLGPVLRVLILAAAMTGLRQSELLGLRWRGIDWTAQRVRVRNTYVRGEHSKQGKSDLSTRRSVPMADRLARELDRYSKRSVYRNDDDLVFAHPQLGSPLDRSKVTKRFKKACKDAGVRPVRFHDLRHTFATRLAASGQPLRTIQEFLGHADSKTTQIYAHYAPSEHELQMVNDAFSPASSGAATAASSDVTHA